MSVQRQHKEINSSMNNKKINDIISRNSNFFKTFNYAINFWLLLIEDICDKRGLLLHTFCNINVDYDLIRTVEGLQASLPPGSWPPWNALQNEFPGMSNVRARILREKRKQNNYFTKNGLNIILMLVSSSCGYIGR